MLTYIICVLVIAALLSIGIKAMIKERKHKRKQLGLARVYDRLTKEHKLAVDYSEFLNYRYIGLDRKNKKLLLIDHRSDEPQESCIALAEIGESKIVHTKDEQQCTKTIWLELRNKRNNKPVRFCFFNREHDPVFELPSLSRKAINWKTKVDIHKHPGNVRREAEYVL